MFKDISHTLTHTKNYKNKQHSNAIDFSMDMVAKRSRPIEHAQYNSRIYDKVTKNNTQLFD